MKKAKQLFGLVVLTYVVSSGSLPPSFRALIGLAALVATFVDLPSAGARFKRATFALLGLLFAASAFAYYDAVANHHWVMLYACVMFGLAEGDSEQGDGAYLQRSAALLIAALMGVAVLQKIVAPEFCDGSFFAHLIDTGALGGPSWALCESCEATADRNVEAIVEQLSWAPRGEILSMEPVVGGSARWVSNAAKVFAASVLIFEIWLAAVYAWADDHPFAPLSLLAFAFGLVLMRAEWVFGALVCTWGVAACPCGLQGPRRALTVGCYVFVGLRVLSRLTAGH